jgi:Secretion system C-terminal sorting domain
MAKQLQLTIPIPCHEDWDAMTPVDKGKFCGSCQKQVVDFSDMSDRQVAEFFKKPILSLSKGGSVCGRFMNDQLDRAIDIPKKRIPWVKYFFQISLPAFLLSMKSSTAKAQGTVTVKQVSKPIRHLVGEPVMTVCSKPVTNDTIVMPEVVVVTANRSTIKGKVVNSVSSLQAKVAGPVITVVDKPVDITASRDLSFNPQIITSALQGRIGGVVVGVNIKSDVSKTEKKNMRSLVGSFKDTVVKSLKVFPNPVLSGSNLTIESKQIEEGYYQLQLLNQSGQSVHQQEIWFDAEIKLLNVDVPAVAAGSYFLVLTNKKSGKKFTEKIVIQ